jgi:hypothetical protein
VTRSKASAWKPYEKRNNKWGIIYLSGIRAMKNCSRLKRRKENRTSKATSVIPFQKWHQWVNWGGPTHRNLIVVSCVTQSRNALMGYYNETWNYTGFVLTLMDFPFWATVLTRS